jgi:hypothetical protein
VVPDDERINPAPLGPVNQLTPRPGSGNGLIYYAETDRMTGRHNPHFPGHILQTVTSRQTPDLPAATR